MTRRQRPPTRRPLAPAFLAAALTTAAAATTAAAQPPPSPAIPELSAAGSVTLPYAELRALWLAAQPKPGTPPPPVAPPKPPVPYALQSARYLLEGFDPVGRLARGRATFEVLALNAEGWTAVPLLPADGGVRLAGVEPPEALLAVRDNVLTLLLDRPGRHVVTLRFEVELLPVNPAAPGSPLSVRFPPLPPALVNELTVTDPPAGSLAEIGGRPVTPGTATPLAAGQGGLVLALVRAEDRQPAPPPAPSRWRAEAQALVRFDEGRLLYKTRLRADAESGSGLALALGLPPAANVLNVEGADLDRWRASRTEAGRRLEVSWKTPDVLRREVFISYELPQPAPEGDWTLVAPVPVAAGETDGGSGGGGTLAAGALFVLPAIPGLEFSAPDGTVGVDDPRALPRWLAEGVNGEGFLAVAAPGVRARRLPLVRTAAATVAEARFHTRLVADGATFTEGTLTVRHDAPVPLRFTLPENAQLLACAVEGRDLAPVDRGAGRVELALPSTSGGGGGGGKGTRVTFSYAGRERPLAPVAGRVALALPEVDLFVQSLWWNLQIPDAYEVEDLDGNVHRDESAPYPANAPKPRDSLSTSPQPSSPSGFAAVVASPAPVPVAAEPPAGAPSTIRLRKELIRAERPTVDLFYQKRAVAP